MGLRLFKYWILTIFLFFFVSSCEFKKFDECLHICMVRIKKWVPIALGPCVVVHHVVALDDVTKLHNVK